LLMEWVIPMCSLFQHKQKLEKQQVSRNEG
jgi:hypothetical protein